MPESFFEILPRTPDSERVRDEVDGGEQAEKSRAVDWPKKMPLSINDEIAFIQCDETKILYVFDVCCAAAIRIRLLTFV